ncbi:MAG: archaeal proteasome endopeptidase complex subunit alpha [Nanoarchaeota archaeon]|nr:archaeal proteasome endopeptidase complex subunit alpha [Nanoarchaeota archaeon]
METNHQAMGYDRAITMFSPDGRLLQVEYAKKTVKQGSSAIGMVCKDGVLLVTDKRLMSKLLIKESVEKIWQIDDHIAATASGILSDARVLIEHAQVKAQNNMITYNNKVDTLSVVKDVCQLKQVCTQSGGLRPFGVSLLVVGVDEMGPKLFETDPIGIYFQYKATAIGECDTEIEEILDKEYKDTMTIEQGLDLAVKALKKVLGKNFKTEGIDAAYIKTEEKMFKRIDRKEIEKSIKK